MKIRLGRFKKAYSNFAGFLTALARGSNLCHNARVACSFVGKRLRERFWLAAFCTPVIVQLLLLLGA